MSFINKFFAPLFPKKADEPILYNEEPDPDGIDGGVDFPYPSMQPIEPADGNEAPAVPEGTDDTEPEIINAPAPDAAAPAETKEPVSVFSSHLTAFSADSEKSDLTPAEPEEPETPTVPEKKLTPADEPTPAATSKIINTPSVAEPTETKEPVSVFSSHLTAVSADSAKSAPTLAEPEKTETPTEPEKELTPTEEQPTAANPEIINTPSVAEPTETKEPVSVFASHLTVVSSGNAKAENKPAEPEKTETQTVPEKELTPADEPTTPTEPEKTEPASAPAEETPPHEEPAAEITPAKTEPVSEDGKAASVVSYFAQRGISTELSNKNTVFMPPVEKLAYKIAQTYDLTRPFIKAIRSSIVFQQFHIDYQLPTQKNIRTAMINLANVLLAYQIIADLQITGNCVHASVSSAPKAINFINGDFMESYARCVISDAVKSKAEQYNCDYELYHNVYITKDGKLHELDLVFRIGGYVFWSEVKSAEFNADTYRKLGISLNLVPDRFIMLAATRSDDECEVIGYINDCFYANIDSLKTKTELMIDKAFNNSKE